MIHGSSDYHQTWSFVSKGFGPLVTYKSKCKNSITGCYFSIVSCLRKGVFSPGKSFVPFVWSRHKRTFLFVCFVQFGFKLCFFCKQTIIYNKKPLGWRSLLPFDRNDRRMGGEGQSTDPEKTNFGSPACCISLVHSCQEQLIQCRFCDVILISEWHQQIQLQAEWDKKLW